MSLSFDEKLGRLAALTVKTGLGLLPGQELVVSSDIGRAPFVRLLLAEAYKAGAKNVFVRYTDEEATLLKFRYGSDEALAYSPEWLSAGLAGVLESGGAFLSVSSGNPELLSKVPAEKAAISAKAESRVSKKLSEAITSGVTNWCCAPHASEGWAKKMFPGEDQDVAIEKLWDAIFASTYIDTADPAETWRAHCEKLERWSSELNDRRFSAVHFVGPGTDLRVGLVDDHLWVGGRSVAPNGAVFTANIPTEEVFTMPHRSRVEGHVSSTKALSSRGKVLDGIRVEFKEGRVVNASAKVGEDVLRNLLDTDEGARSLGEVALVPNSSSVSRTNLLYYNTLFDENAASHIALGQAYGENLKGADALTAEQKSCVGMNESMIHVDWMIGSGEVDVDGIARTGERVPLMRSGEWVPEFAI